MYQFPMKIDVENGDPYEEVCNVISDWCNENFYDSFVVTLTLNGERTSEYLSFDASEWEWEWDMDWWEGEEEVILNGFAPMTAIDICGCPDEWEPEEEVLGNA